MEERKSKKTEAKRTRAEKDKVMDILFSAFEKHQFYNVKDLVGITKQPVVCCVFECSNKSAWFLVNLYERYLKE